MDWARLDEYVFAKLVGELLGRPGFVDIDFQGDSQALRAPPTSDARRMAYCCTD
jgi:hypothetical protein